MWSPVPESAGRLAARVVRVRTLQGLSGRGDRRPGFGALGKPLRIVGVPVDASLAALAGTVAGLIDGDYVIATGTISGDGLIAEQLVSARLKPEIVELRGTIGAFVSTASFLLRGVAVDASKASFPNGPILPATRMAPMWS